MILPTVYGHTATRQRSTRGAGRVVGSPFAEAEMTGVGVRANQVLAVGVYTCGELFVFVRYSWSVLIRSC